MTPQFLKAFGAYPTSPMSVVDFAQGIVHPRQEILELWAVLKPVGKASAGAAFALADPDLDKIVSAICSKARMSWMGISDAWNAVPDINRDIAMYAGGADPLQVFNACRNGQNVPAAAGTAITFPLPICIPFWNIQKENPNVNAPSAGQFFASSRVDLEVVGTALPFNVVLTNGTIAISAITAELWAVTGAIRPLLWMAPASKLIVRAATSQTVEAEGGPLFDEMAMVATDSTTAPFANNDNIQIVIDGKTYLFQTPVANLPAGYARATKGAIGSAPGYDVSQNAKNGQATARAGRVPLIYLTGMESPVEAEYPVAASSRSINFGSKTTAAPNMVFWRQTPITSSENLAFLATMLQDPRLQPYFSEAALTAAQIQEIKNLSFGDLAIFGGGNGGPGARNDDLSLFKPRQFAPMRK